jgi:hypothetical protein
MQRGIRRRQVFANPQKDAIAALAIDDDEVVPEPLSLRRGK